jgi:hypothetical protein
LQVAIMCLQDGKVKKTFKTKIESKKVLAL